MLAEQRLGVVGRPAPARISGPVRYAFGPLGQPGRAAGKMAR
ncbi:MAG TPA: hypothetical protein VI357_24020 [Mycobacteriales bacterium]